VKRIDHAALPYALFEYSILIFYCTTQLNSGTDSSGGIATDYGLDGPGIKSLHHHKKRLDLLGNYLTVLSWTPQQIPKDVALPQTMT
jgi:hypothetical protein